MAKLLGPDFLSLQVRNIAASRAFYTELLGLPVDERFDTPDFVLFDTNSIPFGLSAARVNLDETPQPGLGMTLWLDCDDVDALHAKLQAAGTTIIKPPSKRTVGGRLDDGGSCCLQFGMQCIDIIAVEPERHPQARLGCFIQVYSCCTETEGDRVGIEENKVGRVEALIDRQP